jgi:protein-L-isoaspartate(D-aspartate) O-methyltransferase
MLRNEQATALRERLVRAIGDQEPWGTDSWDTRVLEAMRRVPRHEFVPGVGLEAAYRDEPQPIGHGQTISQPTMVALMTNALELRGRERVLEIGTGCGYQTAVLAELAREVDTIEVLAHLAHAAALHLARYRHVHMHIGDGHAGLADRAPFDRIVLTAAPASVPLALFEQLADDGILLAPVGVTDQQLFRWRKRGGALAVERLGAVRFVPMVPTDAGTARK